MDGKYVPTARHDGMKRKHPGGQQFRNKKGKTIDFKDGSHESVLQTDIVNLLKSLEADGKRPETRDSQPPEQGVELDLTIAELSSTGDGLAYHKDTDTVLVVPYTTPGDNVTVEVARSPKTGDVKFSHTDLLRVNQPGPQRDDSLIKCEYFARCSGCQFQMMPYERQLLHKQRIVEKAYQNFSDIDVSKIPAVQATMPSPLQYGYRTKLTPHFDGPPRKRSDRRNGIFEKFTEVPPIGYMGKNSRQTIDIEDCPIGTEAVLLGMKKERQRVADELDTFKRGVTLLLRQSTQRTAKDGGGIVVRPEGVSKDVVVEDRGEYVDHHTCITDQNAKSNEYVDDFLFTNRAGGFFQNNNSILSTFTQYIRDRARKPGESPESSDIKHLIDAYCGSGLFSITLASMFEKTIGIDIDATSISSAENNARQNGLPDSKATFIAADAKELFKRVKFPPSESLVIIDPPRKGCDEDFLRQLLDYGPARIVYVSCNVHTQARDVEVLVNGLDHRKGARYEIESLRGFDFFPQTGHVEGVAVLNRIVQDESTAATATTDPQTA